MFALLCTKKLRKRLPASQAKRAGIAEIVPPTTTKLGNWIANLLVMDRKPTVLAVSNLTLLPVLLPLTPTKTFAERLPEAIVEMLEQIGVPEEKIRAERVAMTRCFIDAASVSDNVVVGSLNDFAKLLTYSQDATLTAAALRLSAARCSPLQMERPRDVARAMFAMPDDAR